MRRHLDAAQRLLLLGLERAYRTTPTEALGVINGTPPTWVEAMGRAEMRDVRMDDRRAWRMREYERLYPGWRVKEPEGRQVTTLWGDWSERGGVRGMGLVEEREGALVGEMKARVEAELGTVEGELLVVEWALGVIELKQGGGIYDIRTDSRGVLGLVKNSRTSHRWVGRIQEKIYRLGREGKHIRLIWADRREGGIRRADRVAREGAIQGGAYAGAVMRLEARDATRKHERDRVMDEWQRLWNTCGNGRSLHGICAQVGSDRLRLSFKAVQLATGHGNLEGYLHRFRLTQGNGLCMCGGGIEDVEHVVRDCTTRERVEMRAWLNGRVGEWENLSLRHGNERDNASVGVLNVYAEGVMRSEDYEPNARPAPLAPV